MPAATCADACKPAGYDFHDRGPLPGHASRWAHPEEAGMSNLPFVELDEQFQEWTSNGETPGLAYAVFKDGRLVRARAFGVTEADSKEPWRFDTICRLYSMTKTVAVCGLMCLVEDGSVHLEDLVSKYIPSFEQDRLTVVRQETGISSSPAFEKPKTAISLRHLLTHTSGLAYGAAVGLEPADAAEESYETLIKKVDQEDVLDLEHWCNELAKIPLRFQPGDHWEYSYGLDLIGRVIEIASEQRLDDFLQARVIQPLGLVDTGFVVPEAKRHRLAAFYRRDEDEALHEIDGIANSVFVHPRHQRILSAGGMLGSVSGGLVSTLNDFVRLCLMLQGCGELDGVRILRPETVECMRVNLLPHGSWCLNATGLGFCLLGSVAVPHESAHWRDVPGEIGWGGLAGTAWAVDYHDKLVVVSFCQVMYELVIDEQLREAVRKSIGQFREDAVGNLLCVDSEGKRVASSQAEKADVTPPASKRLRSSSSSLQGLKDSEPKEVQAKEEVQVGA